MPLSSFSSVLIAFNIELLIGSSLSISSKKLATVKLSIAEPKSLIGVSSAIFIKDGNVKLNTFLTVPTVKLSIYVERPVSPATV